MATRTKFTKTPFRERERTKKNQRESGDSRPTGYWVRSWSKAGGAKASCVLLRSATFRLPSRMPSEYLPSAYRLTNRAQRKEQRTMRYTLQHLHQRPHIIWFASLNFRIRLYACRALLILL